jgi:hypothetical protein
LGAWEDKVTLSAHRVVVGDLPVGGAGPPMTLHRVLFADDGTQLDLSGIESGGASGAGHGIAVFRGMPHQRPGPQVLSVQDDQGTTTSASPQGGWSSGGNSTAWNATFVTDIPLSGATTWIAIDGVRCPLPDPTPPPPVRLEQLEAVDPVRALLYDELIAGLQRHVGGDGAGLSLAALVALGALAPDDPLVAEVGAAQDALAQGRATPGLGEPWRSVLRRFSKSDGPVPLNLPIGVVAEVGGCSIRFDALTSRTESFSVSLAVSPGLPLLQNFPGPTLERTALQWWAEDDRANVYLAAFGHGGGGPQLAEGTIEFMSPLDPQATELRLLPTARGERAVITVALGRGAPR